MAQIKVTWKLEQPITENEIDRLVDVDAEMAEGDLEHLLVDEAHNKDVDWAIDLRFDVQVQSHAQQEPRAAIARFNEAGAHHKLEIWTGTQDPWGHKAICVQRHWSIGRWRCCLSPANGGWLWRPRIL